MANKKARLMMVAGLLVIASVGQAAAAEIVLNHVVFPERRDVDLEFVATPRAPRAELRADVRYREGQAIIELKFSNMKPAILFGGDVTSYVLWAVERAGTYENLGELWVRKSDDRIEYSTGLKAFALLVTAESYPLVDQPSELVVFTSAAPESKRAPSDTFTFTGLGAAPKIEYPSIAPVIWDESQPLDLAQAEKAYELATREGAADYAAGLISNATTTLAQARNLATKGGAGKTTVDYSRRTVALASEALQKTRRTKEAEALARQIAERRAEMNSLEERARNAEALRQEAEGEKTRVEQEKAVLESEKLRIEAQKTAAEAAVTTARLELDRLAVQMADLEAEQQRLEEEKTALQKSVADLDARAARLREEKEELSERLQGALSLVADTRSSARGMIVNLPDILFEVNEANLKGEARVVLAKLAGILLIMKELNLRVEGHTDASGSDEYNQQLSERRASSVRDFLAAQGIDMNRMIAVGYGEYRPVADNDTREGRARNRRVEIVIAEGEVAEAPTATP